MAQDIEITQMAGMHYKDDGCLCFYNVIESDEVDKNGKLVKPNVVRSNMAWVPCYSTAHCFIAEREGIKNA